MYVPDAFRIDDREDLLAFIAAYDFATLVSVVDGAPEVSHLPLVLGKDAQGGDILRGHVARANAHWKAFDGERRSLAIFHGPHGYVSPSWYGPGPAVPTWNYAVVHVGGAPRRVEDPAAKRALLDDLVERYESGRPEPWKPELDEGARAGLERGIVAFELPVEELVGKFKLGQNRPAADRRGTLAGLEETPDGHALAALTRRYAGPGR